MRTRYTDTSEPRNNVGGFAIQSYYKLDGHWEPGSPESIGVQRQMFNDEGYEEIIDFTGPSKITKPVTHTKWRCQRHHINSYDEYTSTNRYVYNGPNAHWHSWGTYGALGPTNVGVEYTKTVPELLREAKHKFASSNETDNLLNLVESGQLVGSVRSFMDWVLPRYKRTGRPRKPNSGNSLLTWGEELSGVSSSYLFWSFGVAPLINDIKKIDRGIRSFKRDLDRYIRNYQKPYTSVAACSGNLSIVNTSSIDGYSPNANGNDSSWWHAAMHGSARRLVGVRGHRNVDYQSDAFKKLNYVISRYVATGPASFLWEKIPWSFVADWIFDLSSIVDALDNAFTGFSVKIDDCWLSEKYTAIMPVYKHKYAGWVSSEDGTNTALNEVSYYHREWLDPTITVGLSHRFGKKQVSLLAALLHQQVANLIRADPALRKKLRF